MSNFTIIYVSTIINFIIEDLIKINFLEMIKQDIKFKGDK